MFTVLVYNYCHFYHCHFYRCLFYRLPFLLLPFLSVAIFTVAFFTYIRNNYLLLLVNFTMLYFNRLFRTFDIVNREQCFIPLVNRIKNIFYWVKALNHKLLTLVSFIHIQTSLNASLKYNVQSHLLLLSHFSD